MSISVFLPSLSRSNTSVGWLNGYHSFNFGNFKVHQRDAFGPLIILNDDTVQPGKGFGMHKHRNMEIISIPLSGEITHRDNVGNEAKISTGQIQLMSAGSGVEHSEFNSSDSVLRFLQIWITPQYLEVKPNYQQLDFADLPKNSFHMLISPTGDKGTLRINQQAWLYLGTFTAQKQITYSLKKSKNGVYVFVITGKITIDSQVLGINDALTIQDQAQTLISIEENTQILIIEVPLK